MRTYGAIVLDVGHLPREGAVYDPDGAGPLPELRETVLARTYRDVAADVLRNEGFMVFGPLSGPHSERWAATLLLASQHDGVLYVSCHVNAGKGNYGRVFYVRALNEELTLTTSIANTMAFLVHGGMRPAIAALGAWPRPYACLAGFKGERSVAASLLEPGFIDNDKNANLWTEAGLVSLGRGLAAGIVRSGLARRVAS